MSALETAVAKARAPREDLDSLEQVIGRSVDAAERVGTGRNSRVYRVRCGKDVFAAKFYFRPTADGRDRLQAEFSALRFLWGHGVRCIAEPLRADAPRQVGLYQFVEGLPVDARRAASIDVEQLLSFVRTLKGLAGERDATGLNPAAEAFFRPVQIVDNVRQRLARLETIQGDGSAFEALHRFLGDEFRPALDAISQRALRAGEVELARELRTLSPSDLGFHNTVRRADGQLVFLDFEYFGWDDPAKTISDALLHPLMQLAVERKQQLSSGFDEIFGGDPAWEARVRRLYPLFALKWCMILLNEFRPDQVERRRYVDGNAEEVQALQMRQLEAARIMLHGAVGEQSSFPFWGAMQLKSDAPMGATPLDARSRHLRRQIVRVLERGGRGHLGTSLSLVEMLRVLFDDVLRYDARNPAWPERDRFILSKGHGCITLYVLLQEKGFFPEEELWKFCKFDGILGGHPDPKVPGIEVSTGSLGHGLPIAVGMAVAAKRRGDRHRVVAVLGDGECDEGSVWEAAMSAAKHRLDNLVVLIDYNKQQSYGSTYEVLDLEPFAAKWEAFGFATREVDGHDVRALQRVLAALPFAKDRPAALICHTVKGKGISFAEHNMKWHHKSSIKSNEVEELMRAIEASE